MRFLSSHSETHLIHRIGWLRAAVLGANDGIVSTASLIVGVASASEGTQAVLLAGSAGLVAGAMSMAAGEYISVSSQSDTEAADLARERKELAAQPEFELRELAGIYEARGLSKQLAAEIARELTKRDALGSHARDELGITEVATARPVQAALTSAATFAVGAALPLLSILIAPGGAVIPTVSLAALLALAGLGLVGARAGGASPWRGMLRVTFWGALAMAATAAIGTLFGAAV
jgi:VIT1/CCC1 family predicted Fe2+/Mn2+ transporter